MRWVRSLALLALALAIPALLPGWAVGLAVAFVGSFTFFMADGAARRRLVLGTLLFVAVGTTIYGLAIEGPPVLVFAGAQVSQTGLVIGLMIMTRLFLLGQLLGLVRNALTPSDLLRLTRRRPMAFYALASLLRLMATIREDARRIWEAQLARGHDPGRGVARMRGMVPLLVPLFVGSLRRAHEQASALALARGAR